MAQNDSTTTGTTNANRVDSNALYLGGKDSLKNTTASTTPSPSSFNKQQQVKHPPINYFNCSIQGISSGYELVIKALDDQQAFINNDVTGNYTVSINQKEEELNFINGIAKYPLDELPKTLFISQSEGSNQFYRITDGNGATNMQHIPLWLSIIPPLVAILLALLFREVISSLFLGIWAGAFILNGFSLSGLLSSFFNVMDTYVIHAMSDADHVSVILFSLVIGGMVAIISRNGGMTGVVNRLSGFAQSAKSSQLVTWLLGVAIFFDDYANTLIVGNTARTLTDRYKVSREKLAYIVDSTAAPVASIAFITTWIGAELGYIDDAISTLPINESAYGIFLQSLAYAYYPILALIFILLLVVLGRDYGPMYTAEKRARTTGKVYRHTEANVNEGGMEDLTPLAGTIPKAYNAILPVVTVVLTTLGALFYTGYDANLWGNPSEPLFTKLYTIIGNANSYIALIWSSLLGALVAIFLTVAGRIMNLEETINTFMSGVKVMIPAMAILVFAWSLGQLTKDLHTAQYLTSILEGNINARLLPALIFALAALVAFSTGSSWSTMTILYPIALPTVWAISQAAGLSTEICMVIFYSTTSAVLAGSVLGDHCSPISDTTILSSLASNCNHIDHVRTQLPYALTVGSVSIGLSICATVYEFAPWLNFCIGIGILLVIVLLFGKKVGEYVPTAQELAQQQRQQIALQDTLNTEAE